jgi:hypothetical protein
LGVSSENGKEFGFSGSEGGEGEISLHPSILSSAGYREANGPQGRSRSAAAGTINPARPRFPQPAGP